jgi:hypothetical protein
VSASEHDRPREVRAACAVSKGAGNVRTVTIRRTKTEEHVPDKSSRQDNPEGLLLALENSYSPSST